MEKIQLSECSPEFAKIKAEWAEKSKGVTLETLPAFLDELAGNYSHDYGTICHAMATAAIAAACALDRTPQGGITGFQAGAIMWEFIRGWNYTSNKCGLAIVDYDNLLYPQYSDKFSKTISACTWENLQKIAAEKILEADAEYQNYLEAAKQYEEDIAEFKKKYPGYIEIPEYYERLSIGTGDEWAAEKKKEESGFEFAPRKPYEPVNSDNRVYRHWQSIVDGVPPFGFRVEA